MFAQVPIPSVPIDVWTIILSNGGLGLIAAVLLILVPFVLCILWLIIQQQGKFTGKLIDGVTTAVDRLGESLGDKIDTLNENLADRVDTQTQLLNIFIQNSLSTTRQGRNELNQLLAKKRMELKSEDNPSPRANLQSIK